MFWVGKNPTCLSMDTSLFKKYGGNVPRYTSYPTAVQFGEQVNAGHYAGWLEEIDAGEPISLYLHIPYCHKLCWYCACHTSITTKYSPIGRYVELLKKEIELVSRHLKVKPKVSFIHWGGGSPNMLSPEDFKSLMEAISAHFDILPSCENAMEVDPRSMTREKAKGFVRAGINRVSLGVQDFNPHVQKLINRIQPFEMTRDIVSWLRSAAIKGINFDLMYGLPGQTLKDVIKNADMAMELAPDRLAVFGYAHVPWMKSHMKLIHEEDLPPSPVRLEMAEAISARLKDHGYVQIGLDHFALASDSLAKAYQAGTLKRNFQGYTTDSATTLIALGASSIGRMPGGFVQNTPGMKTYASRITEGELATARGVWVSDDDLRRWNVIQHLMCQHKIEAKTLKDFKSEATILAGFERDGLLERAGSALLITESGHPFVRSVAAVFDQYLQENTSRHSKVV